jgi:hypothetical protein
MRKKTAANMLMLILGAALGAALLVTGLMLSGGGFLATTFGIQSHGSTVIEDIPVTAAPAELISASYDIIESIKSGDYTSLSTVVHPEYGVVFSPYATVVLSSGKCFTPAQVAGFGGDETRYVWGVYSGSGAPIELTPAEYFREFVFNRDYTEARELGIDYVVQTGNALENIRDVFPGIRYIDFHMPADVTGVGEYGWSSLRLGFEQYDGKLKLTLIQHSEWTA